MWEQREYVKYNYIAVLHSSKGENLCIYSGKHLEFSRKSASIRVHGNFFLGSNLLVVVFACCENFQEIKKTGGTNCCSDENIRAIYGAEYHVYFFIQLKIAGY